MYIIELLSVSKDFYSYNYNNCDHCCNNLVPIINFKHKVFMVSKKVLIIIVCVFFF
jgi:hypothetical protein